MSAPKTSDPIAVMTKDGAAWLRRVVTGEGRGLYAVDGSCACPEYLMATLAELAEHGIAGMADALPMPVGPEPELAEDRERVELLAGFERALSPFCSDPKSAAAAVASVRDPEVEWLLRDAQRLQDRVIELEALTPAPIQTCRVCGAGYTYGQPCSTCEFRARMAAEGYDASGASVEAVTSRWSRFFAPTQAYREEALAEEPALTVFRASHDSIVMGLYTTAAAARAHCEAEERRSWAAFEKTTFDWIEDEEDGVAEMTAWVGNEACATGYEVTALEIASAYDEDGDE